MTDRELSRAIDADRFHKVDSVTKREGEPYVERVVRAGRDKIGRAVKLADMRDNLRPGAPESLHKRYRKGIAALETEIREANS